MTPVSHFPALARHDDEAGWIVKFPDFPDCMATGTSLETAIAAAEHVLARHVADLRARAQPLPEPSRSDRLVRKKRNKGQALLFVPVRPPKGRAKRVNISLDEYLLADIDRAARAQGSDRSGFLAAAARDRLARG